MNSKHKDTIAAISRQIKKVETMNAPEYPITFTELSCELLSIHHWQIHANEHWCILGSNGSGKGLLANLICKEIKPESGTISNLPDNISLLSFETQQSLYEKELYEEDTDFLDHIDHGTTVKELIFEHCLDSAPQSQIIETLAAELHITHLYDRGYRLLSSGEARKVLLLREISQDNSFIILDEPFDGLDVTSYMDVNRLLSVLISQGKHLLLMVNRATDIPEWITHIAIQHRGQFIFQGTEAEVKNHSEYQQLSQIHHTNIQLPKAINDRLQSNDPLIKMTDTRVSYGDTLQFSHFNWQLNSGEHCIITGPNGAGKSTLLQLITGDHPQCYGNQLEVFGIKRGSGESIWDIKKHMGIISSSLHRDYRAQGSALTTVISGLYDSIGLYNRPTLADKKLALEWLRLIGLESLANKGFRQLSYGQQRLILIARGLIKQPALLILDEPTQGLDDVNRHLVLAFIEKLADLKQTTLLFVSHRQDEHLPLFKHRLDFYKSESGLALYDIECLTSD